MNIRKSAVNLTDQERDRFLEALIRLKNKPAPVGPPHISVYDQYVLLHVAVMAVLSPGESDRVNLAHWNIGFLPWHRQYLRSFELELQKEITGVTLPYWDWTADAEANSRLFTDAFLGELHRGDPTNLTGSVFRNPVPTGDRPASWWPASAEGWPVVFQEDWGPSLQRGSEGGWPPREIQIQGLEQLDVRVGFHHFWPFWLLLEGGAPSANPLVVDDPPFVHPGELFIPLISRSHNAGHNYIGGHMSGNLSPNDPVFWLHHANVDRIWDSWQKFQRQEHGGSFADHYPPKHDVAPWNGRPIPTGHGIDDLLWPWVAGAPGYEPGVTDAVKVLLPDFSGEQAVHVRDVLDSAQLDVEYR